MPERHPWPYRPKNPRYFFFAVPLEQEDNLNGNNLRLPEEHFPITGCNTPEAKTIAALEQPA